MKGQGGIGQAPTSVLVEIRTGLATVRSEVRSPQGLSMIMVRAHVSHNVNPVIRTKQKPQGHMNSGCEGPL